MNKDVSGNREISALSVESETPDEKKQSFAAMNNYVREQSTGVNSSKSTHDANKRPYKGEPGSTYVAPNGDWRIYGPDGAPLKDYDHGDHGYPDKHPHDENGGHYHDWEDGVHGDPYVFNWEPVVGVGLITVCAVGVVWIVANDISGVGAIDDAFLVPLGEGIKNGVKLIFKWRFK